MQEALHGLKRLYLTLWVGLLITTTGVLRRTIATTRGTRTSTMATRTTTTTIRTTQSQFGRCGVLYKAIYSTVRVELIYPCFYR